MPRPASRLLLDALQPAPRSGFYGCMKLNCDNGLIIPRHLMVRLEKLHRFNEELHRGRRDLMVEDLANLYPNLGLDAVCSACGGPLGLMIPFEIDDLLGNILPNAQLSAGLARLLRLLWRIS